MKCLLTHNDGLRQKRNSPRKSEAEEKWDTLGGLIFINKHKGWYAEMSIEGACVWGEERNLSQKFYFAQTFAVYL